MKRINIVTTTYNDAHKYLIETIQSVNRQVFSNSQHEIIHTIVNDGSTSIESINYLEKIEGLKSINFISQKNSGLSAARNKGIESVSSDYILPLDADDLIHPCLLEILIKEMTKTKNNNKIAFSNWASFGAYKRMIKVRQPTPYTIRYTNYLPVTVLMPTQLCLDNKYDENMNYGCEDWELWIRLICSGCSLLHNSLYGYYHREHSVNMTDKTLNKMSLIRQYIKEKHQNLYSYEYNKTARKKFKPSIYDNLRCQTSPLLRRSIISLIR